MWLLPISTEDSLRVEVEEKEMKGNKKERRETSASKEPIIKMLIVGPCKWHFQACGSNLVKLFHNVACFRSKSKYNFKTL